MGAGTLVKVLPPFADAFPDTYTIKYVDGNTAYLDGIPEGYADAFDVMYLVIA